MKTPPPPDGTRCDCCDQMAAKTLCPETSKHCNQFFWGWYCESCYDQVEGEMAKYRASLTDEDLCDYRNRQAARRAELAELLTEWPEDYMGGEGATLHLKVEMHSECEGTVRSVCPECKVEFDRPFHIDMPVGLLALCVCDDCGDSSESITLVGNNKTWSEQC